MQAHIASVGRPAHQLGCDYVLEESLVDPVGGAREVRARAPCIRALHARTNLMPPSPHTPPTHQWPRACTLPLCAGPARCLCGRSRARRAAPDTKTAAEPAARLAGAGGPVALHVAVCSLCHRCRRVGPAYSGGASEQRGVVVGPCVLYCLAVYICAACGVTQAHVYTCK